MDRTEVKVIMCKAAHDEIDKPENHCFPHCRINAICSHGNRIISNAIKLGLNLRKLRKNEARKFRAILYKTEVELVRWTDCNAVLKRELRLKNKDPQTLEEINYFLSTRLGQDQSQWEEVHARGQLDIARPILEIVERLKELGLLDFDPEPIHLETKNLIASRSTSK